ncbi:hypothetical protein POX_d05442 [Penicillium oxalicum]|uniref:hypothetical protein n=1 Tax=Penicillium oxalicum TaxID=69781 RepID=UPI0020B6EBF4|nr:hypothetical protein POX_d05442 [Penicillium oxalicum]KAI2789942.1 hypothetical protein POX_d05442 [Penicillium oxalicum]
MDRPLHLDTQCGQGQDQRYSFLNTPREMQGSDESSVPVFAPRLPSHSVHDPAYLQSQHVPQQPPTTSQSPHGQYENYNHSVQPHQYESDEKKSYGNEKGLMPPYAQCPPVEQHPAFHVPATPNRELQFSPQPPQYPHDEVPSSAGQYPDGFHPAEIQRSETFSIEPDSNPLQSPLATYLPPPTAPTMISSPDQPLSDLGAFHHPGQSMHPNQEAHGGNWHHEMCECSNITTCCLGVTCPCILYGRTQHRLAMKSRKQDPTNMLGYNTLNGSCIGMAFLCGCQWLFATVQHTRTRKAYGIQGNICTDCVRATCCTCCTLIQDEKEIQTREERRGRAAREQGATLLSPYTAPTAMTYPGPPTQMRHGRMG